MRDKLGNRNKHCVEYRAALEELPPEIGEAEARTQLSLSLPQGIIAHAEECDSCVTARETYWASRKLVAGLFFHRGSSEEIRTARGGDAPWFVTRVMAQIATQEAEEKRAKLEWSGAVSRLASRLAWVAAAMLLVTSTWLYGPPPDAKRGDAVTEQAAAGSAPQYLFESAATANFDDALAGSPEKQR